ncbi:hypothetical protein [Marinifilum sp.]|uniref:hypothetical protein n=1 Tax=Marinifilum sp. TaxID=2033137 RepID=UPI003BA8F29E
MISDRVERVTLLLVSSFINGMNVGGYFMPCDDMASKAMRPSTTLNEIVDAI